MNTPDTIGGATTTTKRGPGRPKKRGPGRPKKATVMRAPAPAPHIASAHAAHAAHSAPITLTPTKLRDGVAAVKLLVDLGIFEAGEGFELVNRLHSSQ